MMKRIVSLTLVILMVAALFVGCGSSDSVDGTYKLKAIDGKNVKEYFTAIAEKGGETLQTVLKFMGIDENSLDNLMTLVLKSDGTFSMNSKMDTEEKSYDGTWKQEGDKLTLTIDNEPQEFTLKDGELSFTTDGMTMTLGK